MRPTSSTDFHLGSAVCTAAIQSLVERDPKKLIQQLFSTRCSLKPVAHDLDSDLDLDQEDDNAPSMSSHPTYKTRSVHFKELCLSQAQSKDKDESIVLVTKLSNLSMHKPSYLILYSQCQDCFPSIAQHLPKLALFSASVSSSSAIATVAYQSPPTPAHQQWAQCTPAPPAPPTSNASEGAAFFSDRNGVWSQGCTFCGMLGHCIRSCLVVEEYFNTGRVKIVGN